MSVSNIKDVTLALLVIAFLFFVGSMFGWVLELFFRKFFSDNNPEHKWINPGFLVGPYLPLYGFGLCGLFLMSYIPYIGLTDLDQLTWGKVVICILAMGVMMTLIEYIAGLIFIRGMHIKLWDYSSQWGNIQGIICPLFSLIWTALGAVYYFFVQPHVINLVTWYFNNIAFTFVVGMFFGVFIIDLGYSLHVVNIVRKFAKEHEIVVKYEELKASIQNVAQEAREKKRFVFAFKSEHPFIEQLSIYRDKTLAELGEMKSGIVEAAEGLKNDISEATEGLKKDISAATEDFKSDLKTDINELKDRIGKS